MSHRLGALPRREQKSPSTGVADWTGRRGLKARAQVSNRTARASLHLERNEAECGVRLIPAQIYL